MRIKEICDYVSRGYTPDYVDESPYKVMNQASFSKGYIDESKQRFTSTISQGANIRKGDLLMASTGGGVLGKVFYFDSDDNSFYADSHVTIMRDSKGRNLMKFLYYIFSLKYDEINATMVKGSTNQTELQRNYLLAYELDIPTTSEQQRIVDYLDEKTKAIDTRISVLEKKSEAYKRLKASVINRAVTRGLNPDVTVIDSGIEWIGMIPEHWEIKRYKEFITLQKGKTPKELSYESVGLPYLTMDYLRDRDGKSTVYPESVEGLLEISENEIIVLWDGANAGEFIKSKAGYLGSTMALLLTKGISKNYLYYFLKSIERDSKYYSNGTTIPHFDSGILLNREYPVPPYSEQQAIANYLDAKCSEIDKAIVNIDKQIDALNRLKRSLINEVVTGKRKV